MPDEKACKVGLAAKATLKADRDAGAIQLDSETQPTGAPSGSLMPAARPRAPRRANQIGVPPLLHA